jgi:nucleoid-associated protein YgaU
MPQRHPGYGRRLPALLLLLIATSCNAAEGAGKRDAGEDQGLPAPAAASPEDRVEELTLRLLGMEGKLKESAHARKSADQGRMEAERRFAESIQEIERLSDEIKRLKDAQRELERALSERDQRITQLDAEWLALSTSHEALNRRFEALRAHVPTQDGGTLDPQQARQAAAQAYLALRELLQRAGGEPRDRETREAIAAAQAMLRQRQFALARVADAQGVYRIRSSDSLALISGRWYGDTARWRILFEANRHVLDDPDHLLPGLTLVIP